MATDLSKVVWDDDPDLEGIVWDDEPVAQSNGPELRAHEPGLLERVSERITPDWITENRRARSSNELAARDIAREQGISVGEVYERAGGRRPTIDPEGQGAASAVGQGYREADFAAEQEEAKALAEGADANYEKGLVNRTGEALGAGWENMVGSLSLSRFVLGGGDSDEMAQALADKIALNAGREGERTTGERTFLATLGETSDADGLAETVGAGSRAVGEFFGSPGDATVAVAEQLPNMAPAMGAGAAGAGAGAGVAGAPGAVVGGRSGLALGTAAVELGAEVEQAIIEDLKSRKLKPTASNIKAVIESPDFISQARERGLKKGLTLAAVDQMFLGLSGRVASGPSRKAAETAYQRAAQEALQSGAGREAAHAAGLTAAQEASASMVKRGAAGIAATGIESAGEMTGEAASQQVARGEIDAGDVLHEGLAGLGTSAAMAGAGATMTGAKAGYQRARRELPDNGPLSRSINDSGVLDTLAEVDSLTAAGATSQAEQRVIMRDGAEEVPGMLVSQEQLADGSIQSAILGDDGMLYRISDADGIQLELVGGETIEGEVVDDPDAFIPGYEVSEIPAEEVEQATLPRMEVSDLSVEETDLQAAPDPQEAELSALIEGEQNPDVRKTLKAELAAIQKQRKAIESAEAFRAAAAKTGDPALRDKLLAKADKLAPPKKPEPPADSRGIDVAELPVEEIELAEASQPQVSTATDRPVLQNRDRTTPASVTQMRSIAAQPDYDRLSFSRDFASGAPVVEPGADIPAERMGRSDKVTSSRGRKIPVQYAVVEADQLLPSNDINGSAISTYESGEAGRSRVIAGNGRAAGMQQAHKTGAAAQYREALTGDADLHGIDPAVIDGMKNPVLVRIMPQDQVTDDIGDESNVSGVSELSPAEQAKNDARRIQLVDLEFSDDGRITPAAVRQFVQAMPESERGALLDRDQPSKRAYDRMENAIFATAYESDSLISLQSQAVDPEARTVLSALLMVAPRMAQLKGTGDLDIRDLVVEAAETAVNARRRGEKLSTFINQMDMTASPELREFVVLMTENIRSAKRMAGELENIANAFYAEASLPSEDMFGAVQKRDRSQLLKELTDGNREDTQITGNQSRSESDSPAEEGRGSEARSQESSARSGREEADAGQPVPQQEESFQLSTQTEADIRQREAAQRKAEAAEAKQRAEAEARKQADSEALDFRLSGSDSPSGVGAAGGQVDLADAAAESKTSSDPSTSSPDKDNSPATKITDSGEELGFNRRRGGALSMADFDAMNDAEQVKMAQKSKVWPKPDYEVMVKNGMNPLAAYTLKHIYDSMAAKPKSGSEQDIRAFVETTTKVRDIVEDYAVSGEFSSIILESLKAIQEAGSDYMAQMRASGSVSKAMGSITEKVYDEVFPKNADGERWGRRNPEGNLNVLAVGGNRFVKRMNFSTADLRKAVKEISEGWPAKREAWQRQYKVVQKGDKWAVSKKTSSRTLSEHGSEDAAIDAARELTKTGRGQAFKEPSVSLDHVERIGKARREGDVNSDQLRDTFGFRGVNYGNWMNAQDRRLHTNMAYDAFLDLADVMGIEPKALSLGGMLGIAFGAQGKGGRNAAHFVPGLNEINITKTAGAGSLAHEWGHALDHNYGMLGGLAREEEPFLSEFADKPRFIEGSEIRPEIVEAYKSLVKAMENIETIRTPGEMESVRQGSLERSRASLDSTVKSWGRYMDGASTEQRERFDALVAKLHNGERGEYVKLGKTRDTVGANINALRELMGEVYGRTVPSSPFIHTDSLVASIEFGLDADKFAEIHKPQQVKTTDFRRNARQLDGKKKDPYWATRLEMFARAFEMYVLEKLQVGNAKNDYLTAAWKNLGPEVGHVGIEAAKRYPQGEERATINEAFDQLVAAIEAREEDGRVALYTTPGKAFKRFSLDDEGPVTADGAYSDAVAILGIDLDIPVRTVNEPARADAPAWFDPATGQIFLNEAVESTRSQAAQYIAEEILHAVDVVSGGPTVRTLSTSSKVLRKGAEVRAELDNHFDNDGPLAEWLNYPLGQTWMTESEVKAELFARLGVLYFGDPALMQANLPKTYEVYHATYLFSPESPVGDSRVLRQVRRAGKPASAAESGGQRGNRGQADAASGGSGQERGVSEGLGALRSRITQNFRSPRTGGVVQFSRRPDDFPTSRARNNPRSADSPENQPQFSLRRPNRKSVGGAPLGHEKVNRIAVAILGADTVKNSVVVTSYDSLPERIKQQAQAQGAAPEDVRSVNWHGTTYLVAERMTSRKDVEEALFHEFYGHHGLRAKFQEKTAPKLIDMFGRVGGIDGVLKLAKDQNIDLSDYVEGIYNNNAFDTRYKQFAMMDELLGHMAEATGTLKRMLQEWLGIVRAFLRRNGLVRLSEYTASDLALVLREAREAAVQSGRATDGRPSFRLDGGDVTAPTFYSALLKAVEAAEGAPRKGTAQQWKAWLDGRQKKGEIKKAERDWIGVDQWLEGRESTTREDLADFVRANQVSLQEVTLGAGDEVPADVEKAFSDAGYSLWYDANDESYEFVDTENELVAFDELPASLQKVINDTPVQRSAKFGEYQIPGGEGYRELLLRLPYHPRDQVAPSESASAPFVGDWNRLTRELEEVNSRIDATWRGENTQDRPSLLQEDTKIRRELDNLHAKMVDATIRERKLQTAPYKSGHFDEPNILAHVRFNERTDADGKKVLFIEEIQSDWHQEGRKRGYSGKPVAARFDSKERAEKANERAGGVGVIPIDGQWSFIPNQSGRTPDAPFKATDEWAMLAFKRIVRWGAENEFSRVAWTTGEQQSDRYNLAKTVDSISWDKNADGNYDLFIQKDGRGVSTGANTENLTPAELSSVVGKDAAEKIIGRGDSGELTGLDLKVGGHGMRGFYDSILPKAVNKWAKKFGGKVGKIDINVWEGEHPGTAEPIKAGDEVHSLDITDSMRDAVMAGMPMFSLRPEDQLRAGEGRALFARYAALGQEPVALEQTLDDAEQMMGFRSPFDVAQDDTLGEHTPMAFDPESSLILVNPALPMTRAEAAQYMVEEVLHGIDVVKPDRTISASSRLLRGSGAIRQEAQKQLDTAGSLQEFFIYPLNRELHADLTESRVRAELFARLGVLYLGDPLLMREELPHAYRAYHRIFGLETDSPVTSDVVFRKVWGGGPTPVGQVRRQHRAISEAAGDGARADREQRTRHGLGRIRQAIGRALEGDPLGARIQLGRLRSDDAIRNRLSQSGLPQSRGTDARAPQSQKLDDPSDTPAFSLRRPERAPDITADQESFLGKIGPDAPTQQLRDRWHQLTNNLGLRVRQAGVDRYAALLRNDKALLGEDTLDGSIADSSWVLARMSNAAGGALSAMMGTGRIYYDAGAKLIDVREGTEGLAKTFQKLGSPAEIDRFMGWVAANRARKLMIEGRENLFTPEEIAAGMQLNTGETEAGKRRPMLYATVWREFQQYRNDILDIADATGLLKKGMEEMDALLYLAKENDVNPPLVAKLKRANKAVDRAEDADERDVAQAKVAQLYTQLHDEVADSVETFAEDMRRLQTDQRDLWAEEFYVPFYRVLDEDNIGGPTGTGGLTRQQAYKRLKGGKQNLNDLLENTLMNFHHLLQASLKNRAAAQAVENAQALGIAQPVVEAARNKKSSTWVLIDGERVWYDIDDPLTFKAVSMLQDAGYNNPAMKVGRAFKRFFTQMTTITPQFVVANAIRDTLQALGTSPVGANPAANIAKGAMTYMNSYKRGRMLASGGAFSFGHVYGSSPEDIKKSLSGDLGRMNIRQGAAVVPTAIVTAWRKWNDATSVAENINRAAIWERNVGGNKLKAAFEARDLLDFSAQGDAVLVRILADLVPFMNARLQGLDKLYRSGIRTGAKTIAGKASRAERQAFARFATVVAALSLVSMALYLRSKDDDDYRELEDWQRDTYWPIKIGDSMFFIPKPFEVGVIATMSERLLEQFVDPTAGGDKFAERLAHALGETFAMNPIPQALMPIAEVSTNRDFFTNRPIENIGMQRRSPSLRTRPDTTAFSETVSRGLEAAFGDDSMVTLSPVQLDHLISGYIGQVGTYAFSSADVLWRTMQGRENAAKRWYEYQPMRRFYRNLTDETSYTRYSTMFYDALKESNRLYSDVRHLQEIGDVERAQSLVKEGGDKLAMRKALNRAQRRLSGINKRIRDIRLDPEMDGETKRQELDRLNAMKGLITERIGKQLEERKAAQ